MEGVFVVRMFTEQLGLQPELLLSMQGSKDKDDLYDYKITTNYVNIPVLVRYNITEMFSVHAGPQFGILVSAKEEFDGDKQDIKEHFKEGESFDDTELKNGVFQIYVTTKSLKGPNNKVQEMTV